MNKLLKGYLDCALWSTTGDNGDPLDTMYSIEDIDEDFLEQAELDCDSFYNSVKDILKDESQDLEEVGHDFWLTRNGHGSGFWDGDYIEGEKLSNVAKGFGEISILESDLQGAA